MPASLRISLTVFSLISLCLGTGIFFLPFENMSWFPPWFSRTKPFFLRIISKSVLFKTLLSPFFILIILYAFYAYLSTLFYKKYKYFMKKSLYLALSFYKVSINLINAILCELADPPSIFAMSFQLRRSTQRYVKSTL